MAEIIANVGSLILSKSILMFSLGRCHSTSWRDFLVNIVSSKKMILQPSFLALVSYLLIVATFCLISSGLRL